MPTFWRRAHTTRRVSFAAIVAALLIGCGGKTRADDQCEPPCAVGGAGGTAGSSPVPVPVPVDASVPKCGASCGALAALGCPAGYDAAACVAECESALAGAACGTYFDAALSCLIEHGEPACTFTGVPQFFDPELHCADELDVYAKCAAES
jgi:hypothetical protein